MTDTESMAALVAAVEKGTATDFRAILTEADPPAERAKRCGWAASAYKGNLNAAVQLVDALLPGWKLQSLMQFEAGHWYAAVYHPQGEDWPKWTPYPKSEATASDVARALLLAVLRAKLAEGA